LSTIPDSEEHSWYIFIYVKDRSLFRIKSISKSAPKFKMDPLNTSNYVAMVICVSCALMNIIRLVPFVSQHDMEEETHWISISFSFFLSALLNILQCYILYKPVQRRTIGSFGCLVTSLISLYYLYDLRNIYQIIFHLSASLFITFNIWKRPILGKLPNYNV